MVRLLQTSAQTATPNSFICHKVPTLQSNLNAQLLGQLCLLGQLDSRADREGSACTLQHSATGSPPLTYKESHKPMLPLPELSDQLELREPITGKTVE